MKKITLLFLAVIGLAACQKPSFIEEVESTETQKTKKFTFTVKGDFTCSDMQTRANSYMSADGKEMTDLWVFDFVDGECVQTIHQQPATAGDAWGKPSLSLTYGNHHVYFVASRGSEPVIDETAKTITWGNVRDTFWKDYSVNVVSTSNGNRAVTLDRVATKLKVTANDVVPEGVHTFIITPATWYYGLAYTTGEPVSAMSNNPISVTIPASYIGTSDMLSVSIFSISSVDEWTTNVDLSVKNANNDVIGHGSIEDAPFKRNRATEYTGPMFGSAGETALSLNAEWLTSITGTW